MMDTLRDWAGVVASILASIGLFYTWLTARSRNNATKISEHERKLIQHDRRIQSAESDIKHRPDHDDITELRRDIAGLSERLGRVETSTAALERVARRIEDYLMKETS